MSSTVPLQSSSTLLQVSVDFATPPEQTFAPAEHWNDPVAQRVPPPLFWQSPTVPVGQHACAFHASVRLSSTMPSQSSSKLLHTSTDGPVEPTQLFTPPGVQTNVPAVHAPAQFAT